MGSKVRTYYRLTKPGIIYGNVLTGAAGFLLASAWQVRLGLLAATLGGMALVIAAACVYNNVLDRRIDQKMARTKTRAVATGTVSPVAAVLFGTLLGAGGFAVLARGSTALVVGIGAAAFFDYVVLYGFFKRRSVWGTLVGSVSGAAPVTAGYVAAAGSLNGGAWAVFLIMALWQMPHFYAIGIYRLDDYRAAGLPVLPAAKGVAAAKRHIVSYIVLFLLACGALSAFGYAGYSFFAVMLLLGLFWLHLGVQGFTAIDDRLWARRMFLRSLTVMLGLSAMLALGSLLP